MALWLWAVDVAHAQGSGGVEFEAVFKEVGRVVLEEPDTAPITDITALARFPDGRFLIADGPGVQLRLHAADGRLLGVFGRRGSGPGEFGGPLDVAIEPGGKVFVADARGPFVQRFDRSLSYDTTFNVVEAVLAFQLEVTPGKLLVGVRRAGGAEYAWLSADGSVEGRFHAWPEVILKEPYWQSVARDHASICDGKVLVATSMLYPIQVYDLDGRRLGGFGKAPRSWKPVPRLAAGELTGPDQMKKLADWLAKFTVIDGVACYRDETILVAHGRFASSFGRSMGDLFQVTQYALDVYGGIEGGTKLVEDLPLPGKLLHVGEQVYVLLAVPPDPWTIGIYELDAGRADDDLTK